MSLVRVTNFAISLDGYGAGEPQSLEAPFGHAGMKLHEWRFATWQPGAPDGLDALFGRQYDVGFGAEIMGANKFGPPGWQDDPDWRGWWGEDPPFHTPTYVLTHRPRASAITARRGAPCPGRSGGATRPVRGDGVRSTGPARP